MGKGRREQAGAGVKRVEKDASQHKGVAGRDTLKILNLKLTSLKSQLSFSLRHCVEENVGENFNLPSYPSLTASFSALSFLWGNFIIN